MFWGVFRPGELLLSSRHAVILGVVNRPDVIFGEMVCIILLRRAWGAKVSFHSGCVPSLCPVLSLETDRQCVLLHTGPLLQHQDGSPLTISFVLILIEPWGRWAFWLMSMASICFGSELPLWLLLLACLKKLHAEVAIGDLRFTSYI